MIIDLVYVGVYITQVGTGSSELRLWLIRHLISSVLDEFGCIRVRRVWTYLRRNEWR